jgi:hypothetical protein
MVEEVMSRRSGYTTAIVFYLITVIYMALIFYASSFPSLEQPGILEDVPNIDKIEHLTEFFVLGTLLFLSFHFTQNDKIHSHGWILALTVGILYAISDEVHQFFVPGRSPNLVDLLADTVGITIASFIGAWISVNMARSPVRDRIPLKGRMLDSEE